MIKYSKGGHTINRETDRQERPLSRNMTQALLSAANHNGDIITVVICDALLFVGCVERDDVTRIVQIVGNPAYYRHLSTDGHILIYDVEVSDET